MMGTRQTYTIYLRECMQNVNMMVNCGKDFKLIMHYINELELGIVQKTQIVEKAKLSAIKRIINM